MSGFKIIFAMMWDQKPMVNSLFRKLFFFIFVISFTTGTVLADPKVLILTAGYGAGHNAGATAIRAEMMRLHPEMSGDDIVIKKCEEFMPPRMRELALRGFAILQANYPQIFAGLFNTYSIVGRIAPNAGRLPSGGSLMLDQMTSYIENMRPDVIITTWFGATEALDAIHRRGHLTDIRVAMVHTDHIPVDGRPEQLSQGASPQRRTIGHFGLVALAADIAFMPSDEVRETFVRAGIPPGRVVTSGFPVVVPQTPPLTPATWVDRMRAARARANLPDRTTLLIEGGRSGVGNYPLMIASILHANRSGSGINILAVCADNNSQFQEVTWLKNGTTQPREVQILYNRLRPLLRHGATEASIREMIRQGVNSSAVELRVYGFVRPTDPVTLTDLRLASNVVSAKPGGSSVTELGVNGIVTIVREETVPDGPFRSFREGYEGFNVRAFENAGLVHVNRDMATVGPELLRVATDTQGLAAFIDASNRFRAASRTDLIVDWAITEGNRHRTALSQTEAGTGGASHPSRALAPRVPGGGYIARCANFLVEYLASMRRIYGSARR